MKNFLFVGCGSIGRRHIKNLKSLCECNISAYRVRNESLGEFEKEYNIKTFYNYDEALEQNLDAVFITNPTSMHLSKARQAAEKGIAMFIEKPLSHNLEGVDDFIELCERNKIPVMMGYKMRFHPAIVKIKEICESGQIGSILRAQSYYGGYLPGWHPWEDYRRMYSARKDLGGGVVLDAIHEIDYLYWLFGDVSEVKSLCGNISELEIETEDSAEIIMKFKKGFYGNVHLNYAQHPDFRTCIVSGTEGMLMWNDSTNEIRYFTSETNTWIHQEIQSFDPNDVFVKEIQSFLNCLEDKEQINHTLHDAKRVLEIAVLAKENLG